MNSTSKQPATTADTIDDVFLVGAAAAVFAFKLAIIRYAVVAAVGAYPEPFSGVAGAIWRTLFFAGFGTGAVCLFGGLVASIIMSFRGE